MASLSYSFFVVSLTILLASASALASTKFINTICQHVSAGNSKAFCIRTLAAYPPAASASSTFQAAQAALNLGISHAQKCGGYAGKAAKASPTLKKQFSGCQDAFNSVIASFRSAFSELKDDPDTANYDVSVCSDYTSTVRSLVGKNKDSYSKTIMTMTSMMDNLRGIAVAATVAVGG